MKKKTKKLVKRDDVRYIACAFEYIIDECLMDTNACVSIFHSDNEERVNQIDWSKITAESLLNDKEFRKSILGSINGMLTELKGYTTEKLFEQARTSLEDNQAQTKQRASKKTIADVVKHHNHNNLPEADLKQIAKDLYSCL